jgi:hypothetical protein
MTSEKHAALRVKPFNIPNHRRKQDGSPTKRWLDFLRRKKEHFALYPKTEAPQRFLLAQEVVFESYSMGVCNVCGCATEPGQILAWVPHIVTRHLMCDPSPAYQDQIREAQRRAAEARLALYGPIGD